MNSHSGARLMQEPPQHLIKRPGGPPNPSSIQHDLQSNKSYPALPRTPLGHMFIQGHFFHLLPQGSPSNLAVMSPIYASSSS